MGSLRGPLGEGGDPAVSLLQKSILRVWERLRRGETMDLHPVYVAVALRAQHHGPGPTRVNRDDGAHTRPTPLHMRLYSSLEPSKHGKLRRDKAEEAAAWPRSKTPFREKQGGCLT